MDKIAIIADIHGNMPALSAVERDIKQRGIERIYCLGDMLGAGPLGSKVIDWCRENCEKIVQGNWEDFLINRPEIPKAEKYIKEIGEERFDYLKTLPMDIKLWLSGHRIHLFHGIPLMPERMWMENPVEKQLEMFEVLEDEAEPSIVGYADLHRQYRLDFKDTPRTIFNTGSVGLPYSDTSACYVVLSGELGSKEIAAMSIEHVRVPYDIEQAVENAKREKSWFAADIYEESLRSGVWREIP